MAIDPTDSERVFVATYGGGVSFRSDGCQRSEQIWLSRNTGVDNLYANAIAIDPRDPNLIYAGTNGGVFVSHDGGKRCGVVNDGLLGGWVVYDVAVHPSEPGVIYAATSLGIFELGAR